MLAHDPGRGHPERPDRLRVLRDQLRRRARAGARSARARRPRTSSRWCTRPRSSSRSPRRRVARAWSSTPTRATSPGSYEAARLAAGGLLELLRRGARGRGRQRLRPRAAAGSSRRARARDGLLPLQQRRDRGRASPATRHRVASSIVDWDLHHGNGTQHLFERRSRRALRLDAPVSLLSGHRRGRRGRRAAPAPGRTLNLPFPAGFGDRRVRARLRRGDRARSAGSSRRSSCWSRRASTATSAIRSAACRSRPAGFARHGAGLRRAGGRVRGRPLVGRARGRLRPGGDRRRRRRAARDAARRAATAPRRRSPGDARRARSGRSSACAPRRRRTGGSDAGARRGSTSGDLEPAGRCRAVALGDVQPSDELLGRRGSLPIGSAAAARCAAVLGVAARVDVAARSTREAPRPVTPLGTGKSIDRPAVERVLHEVGPDRRGGVAARRRTCPSERSES